MKRRLRERAQPPSNATRKRKSRSAEVEACIEEDEEKLICDLDELLRAEEAAAWWTEDGERPSDDDNNNPLSDLLQQLAACDEGQVTSGPPKMAAFDEGRVASALPRPRRVVGSDNRNAQAARLNRLRKKEYVSGLEGKVARLSEDNHRLERERRGLEERVRRLEEESRYLRAVLANDSALSQLLGRLTGMGGVKLSTSLFSEKPREHDYALQPAAEERAPPSGGGVCLHVDQDKVSVEFCPACARSAAKM